CPDIGAWRAWLDHEDESARLDEHLTGGPASRHLGAAWREGAASAHAVFALLAPVSLPSAAAKAVARERLRSRRDLPAPTPLHVQEPVPMYLERISTPWRV